MISTQMCYSGEQMLTIHEVAWQLNRCVKTLQQWDRIGVFPDKHTPTGRKKALKVALAK